MDLPDTLVNALTGLSGLDAIALIAGTVLIAFLALDCWLGD